MANIFDELDKQEQAQRVAPPSLSDGAPTGDTYSSLDAPAGPTPSPVYKGSLLPFTRYSDQSLHFEPLSAGAIGAARQAFTLPGRVTKGETKVDLNTPEGMGEILNFATTFGPNVNPAVRSGDRVISGVARPGPDMSLAKTPGTKELLKSGSEKLDRFHNMPIEYNPAAFRDFAVQAEEALAKEGVFRENAKGLYKSLERLKQITPEPGNENLSAGPPNLKAIRENLASHFGKAKENQHGVGLVFEKFNQFIEKPPEGAVLAGPAAEGSALYASGRGDWSAGKRTGGLEDIKRTADFRAASAHSGQNTDNSLRSRVASHVLDARKTKGYLPEEIAQLEGVPLGTTKNNAMRWAGNLMGGGGGLGAGVAGGLGVAAAKYMGLPAEAGMAVPAVGAYLKRAAGQGTAEALDEAIKTQAQRSPLFREGLAGQDLIPNNPARDNMARTLMRMQAQQNTGVPGDKPVLPYDPNFL